MFKYIMSFFRTEDPYDFTYEQALKILMDAKIAEEEEEARNNALSELRGPTALVGADPQETIDVSEYVCFNRMGIITSAVGDSYKIDDAYEFRSQLDNIAVGIKVSYTICMEDGQVVVSNIAIHDDWNVVRTREKSSWCIRKMIYKVVNRRGRQLDLHPQLNLDLNTIASEFVPIVGDWVEIKGKVEIDEKMTDLGGKLMGVEKVSPVCACNIEGWVKQWNEKTRIGRINRDVYFNGDALCAGYMPIIGDKIVATVIDSHQGTFNRRALKILPEEQKNGELSLLKSTLPDFQVENKAVTVSENIIIRDLKLGETRKFKIAIVNASPENLILAHITLPSSNSQCQIVHPIVTDYTIEAGGEVIFEGVCTVKNMGITRELILFTFANFKIGRWVTVFVESSYEGTDRALETVRTRSYTANTKFMQRHDELVRGQRISTAPRFISVRLPEYPLPQRIYDLVLKHEASTKSVELVAELARMKPALCKALRFELYEDRYHTLLHLEEIHELMAIRTYAQDLTCFIKNGEFLMLEIENLSEKRPSLIVGDRILAKDPENTNSIEYEGFIHKVESRHVYIKFDRSYHDQYNGEDVAVMAVSSRTSFRRMHQAIGLAVRKLGIKVLFPSKVEKRPVQVKFEYEPYSDDILKCADENVILEAANQEEKTEELPVNKLTRTPIQLAAEEEQKKLHDTEKDCVKTQLLLEPPPEEKKSRRKKPELEKESSERLGPTMKLEWHNKQLNYFQKEAVRNILLGEARPLPYIIFGPPGTGKTVTVVETILQLWRMIPHSRLLVAAPSNSAADIIALRLVESGVLVPGDLLRLCAYRCVVENKLPLKLVPYCATADIAREGTSAQEFTINEHGLTLGISCKVIGRHRITIGTCSSLGVLFNMSFPRGHFTHVIIDEAAQALEPEVMIPLTHVDPSEGQIILAGDPRQLGPVISSKGAVAYGFEETYLDRLLSKFPYERDPLGFTATGGYDPRLVTRLVYNYRSLPELLTLSSNLFYNGQLIATISPMESKTAQRLNSLEEMLPRRKDKGPPAIVFHGVVGENMQTADCPSWFNPNEVSQIFFYVNHLYKLGFTARDIGIISPYIKQVRRIRALLEEAEFAIPKVGTVEEFQGQEFNVILLTTVRSCDKFMKHDAKYNLGFLSSPRRVNVAITRAQMLLIIVGNPHLLSKDLHWRSVIKYCVENNSYCGCELPSSK